MTTSERLPAYSPPQEQLPAYSPTVQYYSMALIQEEFTTPVHMACNQRWQPMMVELNSTQLNLYSLGCDKKLRQTIVDSYKEVNSLKEMMEEMKLTMGTPKIGKLFKSLNTSKQVDISSIYDDIRDNRMLFEGSDSQAHFSAIKQRYQLKLENSYTLHELQVGEAMSMNQLASAMHKKEMRPLRLETLLKYKNVLRLRVECSQLLMQLWSFHGVVAWYRLLVLGKDLAAPIESRELTRLKSLPSRYTVRNNALLTASMYASALRRHGDIAQAHRMLAEDLMAEDSHMAIFDELFSHGHRDDEKLSTRTRSGSSPSMSSVDSYPESMFDQESVRSTETSASSVADDSNHTITIGKFSLVSYESYYSAIEKQYISVCVPNLNSYDRWVGKRLTISNIDKIIPASVPHTHKDDVFVDYDLLPRALRSDKSRSSKLKSCRTFIVHQHGLVSVALA
ncbi:hypothetical protein DIRU0_D19614 [Diutina rugosa]